MKVNQEYLDFIATACVGNNGYVDDFTIAKGFCLGGISIVEATLKNNGNDIDVLIYPIAYSLRHSAEVFSKNIIKEIQNLYKIRGQHPENFDLHIHKISKLWDYLKNISSIDNRFVCINENLDNTMSFIKQIDDTSETFRYREDRQGKEHLSDLSTINILYLRDHLKVLNKNFEELSYLVQRIGNEYMFKTFFKHISRPQLFEIAEQLPNRNEWSKENAGFKNIRKKVMDEYKLSSNDFSKIIKIIEKNWFLSKNIGIECELKGCNEDDLLSFLKQWELYHCNDDLSLNDDSENFIKDEFSSHGDNENFIEKWKQSEEQKKNAWNSLKEKIDEAIIVGLQTIFYFGRDGKMHEEYYEINNMLFSSNINIKSIFDSLLRKTNFKFQITKALLILGKKDLVKKIIDEKDHNLLNLSDEELFCTT